jgi:polar amino acid transport system substrate-binding protein
MTRSSKSSNFCKIPAVLLVGRSYTVTHSTSIEGPTVTKARFTSLILIAAATMSGCSAAGGDDAAPASQASEGPAGLLAAGELSICLDPTYPPLEFVPQGGSGDPVGFDADSAVALASLWGVEPEFKVVSFDGLLPALQANRCDLVWSGMYVSDERKEVADAIPYLATGRGLVTASDNTDIETVEDLAGKTVAVLAGGVNETELKEMSASLEEQGKSAITVQSYPQNNQTAAAVRNGKDGALKANIDIFEVENELAIYTLKGSPMTEAVTDGINDLAADGTLGEIAEKYGLDPQRVVREGK